MQSLCCFLFRVKAIKHHYTVEFTIALCGESFVHMEMKAETINKHQCNDVL